MIDLTWLAQAGPCKKFTAGQRIPCPGGSGDFERSMYILISGRVDVFRASAAGGTQTAGSILPGDVFGGREFFTDASDHAYTAGVDSIVYLITEESFDDLSWSRPEILFEVLRAAYMPLKKVSGSQKTAIAAGTQDIVSKQKKGVIPEVKGALGAETKTAKQPKALSAQEIVDEHSAMLTDTGLFPEGHNLYPGITKPDYSRFIFSKEYDCPFCKKKFTDFRVFRSKLYESSPMRYDLRRYYTDFQTEWYDVITCPYCLFSTLHNYFTDPKPIQKVKFENSLTAARSSILLDFEAERDIDYVFSSHYLAMICSEGYLSLGRQIRAKLWGNLSWLYEDVGDENMAKFAAVKTAEAYEAVYAETHLTPVQEQITCLSIAGMQHRAGVDRGLKKYLFKAKTVKMGDRTYAKLAEDFMYELSGGDGA